MLIHADNGEQRHHGQWQGFLRCGPKTPARRLSHVLDGGLNRLRIVLLGSVIIFDGKSVKLNSKIQIPNRIGKGTTPFCPVAKDFILASYELDLLRTLLPPSTSHRVTAPATTEKAARKRPFHSWSMIVRSVQTPSFSGPSYLHDHQLISILRRNKMRMVRARFQEDTLYF
jgi:hypothetical protein